ncbi:MAG: hypothetical protein H7231_03490 [Rhodoferax sp.]|nr:hypothetical protein [Actinomycetota bacterium]
MTTSTTTRPAAVAAATHNKAYSALIGVTGLLILLQGLWAGIFLQHDGQRDAAQTWITVHARGAELSILLAAIATAVAFWKMRPRRDLWIGTAVLTAALVLESYLGGLIVDASKDVLTAVHVPLSMVLVGLAVWLPLRARNRA